MKINFFRDTFNKALFLILIFIFFIVVSTTIVIFSKKSNSSVNGRQKNITSEKVAEENYSSYTGLGRLRVVTLADKKNQDSGTVVIISPWFSYTAGDSVFYEELSRKNNLLKEITMKYFSENTKFQLKSKGEEKIKQELCAKLNENLSLNKIKAVYFSEYIFLD